MGIDAQEYAVFNGDTPCCNYPTEETAREGLVFHLNSALPYANVRYRTFMGGWERD